VIDVVIAAADELSKAELDDGEALVRVAFGDSFRAHDWLHGVEGVHVLIIENADLLAHASVVTRTLRYDGDCFTTGYVESVAVHPGHQGRGMGSVIMDHAEAIIRARHELGALNAVQTAAPFYAARGWQHWKGHTQADTPDGVIDTYDPDDRIFLLSTTGALLQVSASAPIICDWRPGELW
jgi:aminoglycoside 2'-N-acetyltransferase I